MPSYPPELPVPDKVDLALRLGRARKQVENVRALCEKAEKDQAASLSRMFGGQPFPAMVAAAAVLAALDNPFGGEQ